ncbi:MAG: 8-amino-7-oxononanoate synthase [Parcubacteria group bacterium]|nr:8-amino-7-oxononanoate synthase [Parcubacteria group bacterium]|tara:strand:- start:875 stop:2095 length:1221 start_codon:yes stop_codon:yes gene_type:complete
MSQGVNYFSKIVKLLKAGKLYPKVNTISGPSCHTEMNIDGKKFLTFCSNNYLGLAENKEITQVIIDGLKKYGVGSGGTRLLSGTLDVQVDFENKLADFLKGEDSITFSSGFLANAGAIRMLVDQFPYKIPLPFSNKDGIILTEELNHASIVDSVRLAKSEKAIYKHNDMKDLERLLEEHKKKKKLIVTDGVFSMDGDLANLVEISKLAKQYDALIYVDDAHGTGVLGPHGEGTSHELGVEKDIDVVMGSFTKAWGSIGGFIVVQEKELADYLRVTARSYIFSDPILPSVVAGLVEALEIIKNGDALRKQMFENAYYLRSELKKMGFEVLGGNKIPIIPPLLGSEKNAIKFSQKLLDAGIFALAVRRPAVAVGQERLRLTTMATHSRKQLDYLLENMEKIGKELKII